MRYAKITFIKNIFIHREQLSPEPSPDLLEQFEAGTEFWGYKRGGIFTIPRTETFPVIRQCLTHDVVYIRRGIPGAPGDQLTYRFREDLCSR